MKSEKHNCDLFLLSSHRPYFARESLREFAVLGRRNSNGWGLGSFEEGRANVIRSADSALGPNSGGDVTSQFRVAMNATCSPTILGHLRMTSSGRSRVENDPE